MDNPTWQDGEWNFRFIRVPKQYDMDAQKTVQNMPVSVKQT
jgi:hypothetical protein